MEAVYDVYAPLVYGIAVKAVRDVSQAGEIVVEVFRNLGITALKRSDACLFALFVERTLCIVRTRYASANGSPGALENMPLIDKLLCSGISLDEYCRQAGITRAEVWKGIREEINRLR